MARIIRFAILLTLLSVSLFAETKKKEIEAVADLDISRCTGTWYEIARLRHWFERNVVAAAATCELLPNGKMRIIGQGQKNTFDGKRVKAKGIAWRSDKNSTAKWRVRFFWPFYGSYWIIKLDPDYRYAIVAHPKRKYLWVLSRVPTMDEPLFSSLIKFVEEQGFDLSRLEKVPQPKE